MLSKNQIKEIQFLHLKKYRDKEKLFITEGVKTALELIHTKPELIKHIFCTDHFYENNKGVLKQLTDIIISVNETELKKISLQENPNEVLIVSEYLNFPENQLNFNSDFSLYLDDIRDPGNMGTMIRLADWYGIHQIFASPNSCELYNPKVLQASMGAFLRVKVVYDELNKVIKDQSVSTVYGALFNGAALYEEKIQGGLIVIGNEAHGITSQNLNLITNPITIPAAPGSKAESLNAAMAASIIVSEFYRQLKL